MQIKVTTLTITEQKAVASGHFLNASALPEMPEATSLQTFEFPLSVDEAFNRAFIPGTSYELTATPLGDNPVV